MAINKSGVDYSLYLVTDRSILAGKDFLSCIEQAIIGGVTLVQLREKNLETGDFYRAATAVKSLTTKYNIPLIINDRMDIMLAVDADGLHIGQKDLPLNVARRVIGADKILGYSVSTVDEAIYGEKYADYLGAGAVFPTISKSDVGSPIGIQGITEIKKSVSIPVVGIGGINKNNIRDLKKARIDGISLISAILGTEDIKGAAENLLEMWAH